MSSTEERTTSLSETAGIEPVGNGLQHFQPACDEVEEVIMSGNGRKVRQNHCQRCRHMPLASQQHISSSAVLARALYPE